MIGIDLFSGAGGMSVGAISAGIEVKIAVEIDKYAAITYKANHPDTNLFNEDIRKFKVNGLLDKYIKETKILFGGPPCQGFSTSNQKTRNKINPNNWLFRDYLSITKELMPEWVVIENVHGILKTESGYFFEQIIKQLNKLGYKTNFAVLNSADFGVPQNRLRVFISGSLHGINFKFPVPTCKRHITVKEAISDLPELHNGAKYDTLEYKHTPLNKYQKVIRRNSKKAMNNLVTNNNDLVIKRYSHIPQGGNWQNIPSKLMKNYKDSSRCHGGIYHRLDENKPSIVLGNYRKNMLIHPNEDRGLSVREVARLQSFPDEFIFYGGLTESQQQVGNAVPPFLSEVIFRQIINLS
jgi:DNA (cytosine-5)-methyltransferase 1